MNKELEILVGSQINQAWRQWGNQCVLDPWFRDLVCHVNTDKIFRVGGLTVSSPSRYGKETSRRGPLVQQLGKVSQQIYLLCNMGCFSLSPNVTTRISWRDIEESWSITYEMLTLQSHFPFRQTCLHWGLLMALFALIAEGLARSLYCHASKSCSDGAVSPFHWGWVFTDVHLLTLASA